MNLYIVRHAEAVSVGGAVLRDADRPLSARGEADAALMGQALARIEPALGAIMTSPLLRAVKTGDIIGRALAAHPVPSISDHLVPGFQNRGLYDELLALGDSTGSVLVVGHQPDVGMFISWLITGSPGAAVAMAPATVARLTLQTGRSKPNGVLQWLLTPEIAKTLVP